MDLMELLKQAQRLTNDTNTDTEVPGVERTMSQVLQATKEFHSRVTQMGTNDLQAHILLGSKGVDLPKLTQKLESLSARQTFEPIDPVTETNVQAYLKNERENAILSVIDETNRSIFKTVERQKWRCIYSEWGEEKEALLNALVGPNQQDFPVQFQMVPTAMADEPTPYSQLNGQEQMYAEQIAIHNRSNILGRQGPNLLTTFAQLVQGSFNDEPVAEMWNVLDFMTALPPVSSSIDPIKNRQTSPQFVDQARTYLERRYRTYMKKFIIANLAKARRGGIPNVYNMVRSYVSVTLQGQRALFGLHDVNNGQPLWPHVYYSLRSGDLDAAALYLKESGTCPDLLTLLTLRKNGDRDTLMVKLEGQLKLEYNSRLRSCSDPYKKAVYVVLLACDPLFTNAELMRSIDDFLWLQLCILRREDQSENNLEQLTFSGLQSLILEKYGENYFNAREKAPLYFQVLTLTGQFEAAIEFLARTEKNRTHAIHMAIALNEISMLGTPSSVEQPLLSSEPDDPKPMKRLNFVRLIVMYAKCFERTDTKHALQYYYLLRHFKSEKGTNVMLTCVCDLLVENCDEAMLKLVFGTEDKKNSLRYGGIYAEFQMQECDKYSLAEMVGDEFSKRCDYDSAIELYFIGGQLDKALRLVNALLAQVVHQPTQNGSVRNRVGIFIKRLDAALTVRKSDLEPQVVVTYTVLTQVKEFFDLYYKGALRAALEILTNNHLIPASSSEVDECVTNTKRMGAEVIKVLPDILLAAMDIVYQEYVKLMDSNEKASGFLDESKCLNKEPAVKHLRDRAKAFTNMAASVPYRMPSTTNQRLVQLEILMH
ncbi:nuclear pore complex protein Nup93-1 [Drosophila mauritiana]|uniref:Nuclear pore protein n=1 Tax=Drosophila mauritiana TaxID=7226 RepID=A0A6P8L1Y3_DROMA|nr:nuclear pore complex protein Nup93-1 [Drosophila mauritiana]